MRSRHWTLVMCIPTWTGLDKYVRETRVSMRLHCVETSWENNHETSRGYFELLKPVRYNGRFVRYLSYGFGTFNRMDAVTKAEYEAIKDKNQIDRIADMGKTNKDKLNETQARFRASVYIMHEAGISTPDIVDRMKSMGITVDYHTIANMISRTKRELYGSEGNTETY